MVPERCERFRESISRDVDGLLSTFEAVLLDRHVARCASCSAFAARVRAQTALLRSAPLERPTRPVIVAAAPAARLRRRAAAVGSAVAVAAAAALVALTPTAGRHESATATQSTKALLEVVPAKPNVEATFEVPRLRVVSPASADGPVRGYYGLPVA